MKQPIFIHLNCYSLKITVLNKWDVSASTIWRTNTRSNVTRSIADRISAKHIILLQLTSTVNVDADCISKILYIFIKYGKRS